MHALHGETPSNINCDAYDGTGVRPHRRAIALEGRQAACSVGLHVAGRSCRCIVQALQNYGYNNAGNGAGWNILGIDTLQQPINYPSAAMTLLGSMRWKYLDLLAARDFSLIVSSAK